MEQKVITVRGKANIKVKPDYVNILVNLEIRDMKYDRGMEETARQLEAFKSVMQSVGLDPDDLRTTDFNVDPVWDYVESRYDDSRRRVFKGYKIQQNLKFGFAFERERLSNVLTAIAQSEVHPEFKIRFTVKDTSSVKEALFEKASENARKIAEGLCRGVGKKLGEILNINYSWQEIDLYHEIVPIPVGSAPVPGGGFAPDINPDDLNASDSVTLTWALA